MDVHKGLVLRVPQVPALILSPGGHIAKKGFSKIIIGAQWLKPETTKAECSVLRIVLMEVDRLSDRISELMVHIKSSALVLRLLSSWMIMVVVIVDEFVEVALCNCLVPSALFSSPWSSYR